jgi:peptidoglycan/LPS O-acetylase OafA/YrhL
MAIQSSIGAGYANPSNFLPPTGWTTTLIGQLLFSCRFAVDTFLILSGYLVVTVLHEKVRIPTNGSVCLFYCRQLPGLLFGRIVRILPLYATTMGLYTLIAPHLGSGPFWHQWLALLKPCHDYGWTNFLFVNNFWPPDTPTTATCFYHSWYIAVDLQLFAVAPLFVFWFQKNALQAQRTVLVLFVTLVLLAAYLGHVNHWSFNTFDGAAVGRFDVQAYAKPHIRAPAYLAGMYTAMLHIIDRPTTAAAVAVVPPLSQSQPQRMTILTWRHHIMLYSCLVVMAGTAFCTVFGAYARRPCTYREDPFHNTCGSVWSERTTWLYTSFSRPVWCVSVAMVLGMCAKKQPRNHHHHHNNSCLVATILSWSCWGPLSRLTFGAYLVHPIIIFVWQLGDREKSVFRLLTFAMNYLSVCCVSYILAFVLSLTIELPCAALWKYMSSSSSIASRRRRTIRRDAGEPLPPHHAKTSNGYHADSSSTGHNRANYGATG